jgi:branched-chain amino acid transport system ATP-binding protein
MTLQVRDLHAYYGQSHILDGIDLDVGEGKIVSLLGRNGVGRTCEAIMGLVPPQGRVSFRVRELAGLRSDRIARAGIGYVLEDRQVFATLSVRQNLKRARRFGRWSFEDVFRLFPNPAARQGNPAGGAVGRGAADAGDVPDTDGRSGPDPDR